jgi:hypothetical protein
MEGGMKIIMCKHLGGLRPVDDAGTQLLAGIKHGQTVMEVIRPRNPKHNAKFFKLLQVVQPNTDYPTVDALLVAMKVYLGHCDVMQLKSGKTAAVPRSIAFHAMSQDAFARFYDGAIEAVVQHFLPGVSESDLRREVEELCGVSGAAA